LTFCNALPVRARVGSGTITAIYYYYYYYFGTHYPDDARPAWEHLPCMDRSQVDALGLTLRSPISIVAVTSSCQNGPTARRGWRGKGEYEEKKENKLPHAFVADYCNLLNGRSLGFDERVDCSAAKQAKASFRS